MSAVQRRTRPHHCEFGGDLPPAVCNWDPDDESNAEARRDLVAGIRRIAGRARAEWWRELTGADHCERCQECDEDTEACECCGSDKHSPDFGYDHRAIVEHDGDLRGVQVQLAGGGPTIWLDTAERRVTGYGWSDVVYADLDRETCDLITEHIGQRFDGQRIGEPR